MAGRLKLPHVLRPGASKNKQHTWDTRFVYRMFFVMPRLVPAILDATKMKKLSAEGSQLLTTFN